MKKYIKSLFPFRWVILLVFMILFGILVLPLQRWDYELYQIIFVFIIDLTLGIGRQSPLFPDKIESKIIIYNKKDIINAFDSGRGIVIQHINSMNSRDYEEIEKASKEWLKNLK